LEFCTGRTRSRARSSRRSSAIIFLWRIEIL
jgi:hypothetical protein